MIEFLTRNWVFILIVAAMAWMHFGRRHGGHGAGHGGGCGGAGRSRRDRHHDDQRYERERQHQDGPVDSALATPRVPAAGSRWVESGGVRDGESAPPQDGPVPAAPPAYSAADYPPTDSPAADYPAATYPGGPYPVHRDPRAVRRRHHGC